MEKGELKDTLNELIEAQNHLQFQRYYSEIINGFESLKKENKELSVSVKTLTNLNTSIGGTERRTKRENTKLKEQVKEFEVFVENQIIIFDKVLDDYYEPFNVKGFVDSLKRTFEQLLTKNN